jgi:hypothetical protein
MVKPKRKQPPERLSLRLYVAGNAPNSLRAIANAKTICDEHFATGHDLESSICSSTRAALWPTTSS